VRAGDSKGRHTTTNRQLHLLPAGGVIIDSPGIREVGLAGDEQSVDATFADVEDVATTCYFSDCTHAGEPGCAVALAVEAGDLTQDRVDAYQSLRAEAASAARRADEHERRAHERRFTKVVKAHVRGKPGNQP
jgi:ribosome biogenesis GTPase